MRKILLSVALIACAWGSSVARADVDADLALAVAKVCANERSLQNAQPDDCALIWQAARRRGGSTSEGRLRWLRAHSSCVLTDRPLDEAELRGNCAWSRHLTDADVQPSGWPTVIPWSNYVRRWAQMRAYCRSLVDGASPPAGWPCAEDPDTWGGPMDHARATRLGLVPLGCRRSNGRGNEGYRFPARS